MEPSQPNPELRPFRPSTLQEVDMDPRFKPGTPENLAMIQQSDLLDSANASAALAQVKRSESEAARARAISGSQGQISVPFFKPQESATWYATIGKTGGYNSNSQEVITSLNRQRQFSALQVKKLLPYFKQAIIGRENELGQKITSGYGEEFIGLKPSEQAEILSNPDFLINGVPAFETEDEKDAFVRYSSELDRRNRTSAYHLLQRESAMRFTSGGADRLDRGEQIFRKIRASTGIGGNTFRLTTNEELDDLMLFYRTNLDKVHDEQGVWQIPQMLIGAFGDVATGVSEIAFPDDQINPEWRRDPAKYKRITEALLRVREASKAGLSSGINESRKLELDALLAAKAINDKTEIPDDQVVVSDPESTYTRFIDQNSALVTEIVQLNREGAFTKEGRIAPVLSAIDGFLVNTSSLVGMATFSMDPESVVNKMRMSLESPKSADEYKQILRQKINEGIVWNEEVQKWMKYGLLFRTNGGAPGENYASDELNNALHSLTGVKDFFQGNEKMLAGGSLLFDPFIVADYAMRSWRAYKTGITRKGVMSALMDTSDAVRSASRITDIVADDIRGTVENVRQTLQKSEKYQGKTLTDMDVLDAISRGEGKVTEVLGDGSTVVRDLSTKELKQMAVSMRSQEARVRNYIAERQAELARQLRRSNGRPFSTFGKWVASRFPNELVSKTADDYAKRVSKYFEAIMSGTARGEDILTMTRQNAPTSSTAFGLAKAELLFRKGAVAAGAGLVFAGNIWSLPTLYTSALMFAPDVLAFTGLGGKIGKISADLVTYYKMGKHKGGSVAALRIEELGSEIDNLKSVVKRGSIELEKDGQKFNRRLTDVEIKSVEKKIKLLESELGGWGFMHSLGIEKGIINGINGAYGVATAGTFNNIFMGANDRANTGGYGLATLTHGVNFLSASVARNIFPEKYRMDQQRMEFYANVMKMDSESPGQAERLLRWYEDHKKVNQGDRFINAVNNLARSIAPGNKITLATPQEIFAHQKLLRSSDLMASAGKNPWDFRQELMQEAIDQGITIPDEIEAYVSTNMEKAIREHNEKMALLTRSTDIEKKKNELLDRAIELEGLTANESAALAILEKRMNEAGIPTTKSDGTPINLTKDDLADINAFMAGLRRELNIELGTVENGQLLGLMGRPNFTESFRDFRVAFLEHAKVKTARGIKATEFGALHSEVEAAIAAAQEAEIQSGVTANVQYRPGQTFAYFDVGTNEFNNATTVADGMFIVDKIGKDGAKRSEIILDISKVGADTIYEEFGHRLFTSEAFSNMRHLLYRNIFGEWGVDDNGKPVMVNEGSLVSRADDGSYDLPGLRMFAQSYASGLSNADANVFMAKVEKGIKTFNENPELGIWMLQDVTNELWTAAYRRRMAVTSPGVGKLAGDVTSSWGGFEGSNLTANRGESSGERPIRNSLIMAGKLALGEMTLSESADIAFRMLLDGKDESQIPVDKVLEYRRQAAKIAATFGAGGLADKLYGKGMASLLEAQGLSPEVFGDGSWTNGKLFDNNGNLVELPAGIQANVDRTVYAVRRGLGNVDSSMYDIPNIYDSKGNPIEVDANNNKFNAVLWAARNNKMHYIDVKTNKVKPLAQVQREIRTAYEQFTKVVVQANSRGELSGFQLQKTDGGIAVGGRITAQEAAKLVKLAKESNLPAADIATLMQVVSAIADSDPVNPSFGGLGGVNTRGERRVNNMQQFVLDYGAVQRGKVGTEAATRTESGSLFRTQRTVIPISIRIEMSGLDALGKDIKNDNNEKIQVPTIMVQWKDLDAFASRCDLGWNGLILGENGKPAFRQDDVRKLFGYDKSVFADAVNKYLELISRGGKIERNVSDTKKPPMTSVEMFQRFLEENEIEGIRPTKENAAAIARVVNAVVGVGNTDYVAYGDSPGGLISDYQIGLRKQYKNRSFTPKNTIRDANFIIFDGRLDRTIGITALPGMYHPWSADSFAWASSGYSPKGWTMLDSEALRRAPGLNPVVREIVGKNPNEVENVKNGIEGAWAHTVGYSIVKYKNGKYRVYDSAYKYIGEAESLGNAEHMASASAVNQTGRINLPFDIHLNNTLKLIPSGLEVVTVAGQRRRQVFHTPDNRFRLTWNSRGEGQITDTKLGVVIAKGIKSMEAERGTFDVSDIQSAFRLAYDNLTMDAPVLDLGAHAASPKPGQSRVVPVSDLEFVPVTVGRKVQGKMVYAATNPAYYAAKRKLVDMLGRKAAADVIGLMKEQLGDQVIASDPSAVARWTMEFLNGKMSKEMEAAWDADVRSRRIESDKIKARLEREAQVQMDRNVESATRALGLKTGQLVRGFLEPVSRGISRINEERRAASLPEIDAINPAVARAELAADMEKYAKMKQLTGATIIASPEELTAYRLAMKDLGNELTALSRSSNRAVHSLWRNKAGYLIASEMQDSPTLPFGVETRVNLSPVARMLPGLKDVTYKTRFRIYNPSGALIATATSMREAAEIIDKKMEREALGRGIK